MQLISRLRDQRYCAFCKSPRRVYLKKHISLTNVAGAILLSLGISYAIYGRPDPSLLGIFCFFTVVGEIFVYSRWRASLVCRLCGFDPVVYKRSPEEASKQVRAFFEEQIEKPGFILSKSPLLELRRRMHEQERRKQTANRAAAAKSPTRTSLGSGQGVVVDQRLP